MRPVAFLPHRRELNSSGLEGPLQWAPLAQLSQLQVLNLYNNSLSGSLGGPLPASLSFLSASMNLLNGTIPAGWTLPPALTELWLALNGLSGSIPGNLQVRQCACAQCLAPPRLWYH